MNEAGRGARRGTWLREGLLLAGFVVLVVAAVVTVVVPELREAPEETSAARAPDAGSP